MAWGSSVLALLPLIIDRTIMRNQTARRWYLWLALVSLVGVIPSIAWVLTHDLHPIPAPRGDVAYLFFQAWIIADGGPWFVSPFAYLSQHQALPSGQHPPLWVLTLVLISVVGLKTFLAQLIGTCLLGSVAVFCTGLAAREVAGNQAGLIAGVIAAVYPN